MTRPPLRPEKRLPLRIFGDPDSSRGPYLRVFGYFIVITVIVWVAGFLASLLLDHPLPDQNRTDEAVFLAPSFDTLFPGIDMPPPSDRQPAPSMTQTGKNRPVPLAAGRRVFATVPLWPARSFISLQRHLQDIDVILPEWLTVPASGDRVLQEDPPRQQEIADFISENGRGQTILPTVRGLNRTLSEGNIEQLVHAMVTETAQGGYDGLCLDLAWTPRQAIPSGISLMRELAAAFGPAGKQTCVIIDLAGRDWPLPEINAIADLVVVIPFDQPGPSDLPSSLLPVGRFQQVTVPQMTLLDPQKTVLALGNSSADWVSNMTAPKFIPFAEVARRSGLHNEPIKFDETDGTSTLTYIDAQGNRHQIAVLDAVSAFNTLALLGPVEIGGLAIMPIGAEDPGLWHLVGRYGPVDPVAILREVPLPDYVGYEGTGGFFTAFGSPRTGIRDLVLDPAGKLVASQSYRRLPETFTVARWGGDMRNRVVLSFDDGPDSRYTRQILDILGETHTPAAFFLIGERAMQNPDVVRRIVADGHEFGIHTFTHPNISVISPARLTLEANATQRLLASISGRNTILFRAPYGEDSEPENAEQVEPMKLLSAEGYISAGIQIDPSDWQKPGAEELVKSVVAQTLKQGGGIILLHDSGGDRTQTVAALPHIIDALRNEGFEFTSLAALLGASRAEIMPPAQISGAIPPLKKRIDTITFTTTRAILATLPFLFGAALVLGVGRSFLIVVPALSRRRRQHAGNPVSPPVTVLIPAFNEAADIRNTIAAVLASDYPDFRVIVIDDGSTDNTRALIEEARREDSRITLLTQENMGKAVALNHGYTKAETDIIVAIDADTLILPDAISHLVSHFGDRVVGAVAGNVKVGNRVNLVTRLQAVEYITSQNLDRRAFERFNAILVVPGAIGAWRRSAVVEAGGYSLQTLAEDADLTAAIIRKGYKVIYEDRAIAMTEAPETLRGLMGQRLRWTLGILQVAWKHRRAVLERNGIGLLAIPNILVFGTLLPLIAPVADVVFLIFVLRLLRDIVQHPTMVWAGFSPTVFALYTVYLLSDVVLSAIAFLLEPKEDKRLLFWVVFQRFFYRQLLYIAVFRSLWRAITGRLSGWRKVVRTGDVSLPLPDRQERRRQIAIEHVSARVSSRKTPYTLTKSATPPRPDSRDAD